jgi:hypothetical protein
VTLEADRVYYRPRLLFRVEYRPQTYVPANTIGVVLASAGSVPPPDQVLCRHVECNSFQDGSAFLLGGGQMGRQPAFLPGGAFYDINPRVFDVITTKNIGSGRHGLTAEDLKEINVPEGTAGVVIALGGAAPDEEEGSVGRRVAGHESFQLPWVFLANGGQRGAQAETLSRGVYRINPWFARVVLIPTRALTLDWTRKDRKPSTNFDAALDQIVVNVEGYRLQFTMQQIIRIPAHAAPRLVGHFGEQLTDAFGTSETSNRVPVQRFVEKVLGTTVEGYFHATASRYEILDFIRHHDKVCLDLGDQVRHALRDWGVEAVEITLSDFTPVGSDLDALRRSIAAERERQQQLTHVLENTRLQDEINRVGLGTERLRRQLESVPLERQVEILGQIPVIWERLLAEAANMKVPQWVGQGVGDLSTLPAPMLHRIITTVMDDLSSGPVPPSLQVKPPDSGPELSIASATGDPPGPPAPTPQPADTPRPQLSADGHWFWDGTQWQPAAASQ